MTFSIEQVVMAAGDGRLGDGTECSRELREFLAAVPCEKLSEYIEACLTEGFPKSGFVLQDIVNDLGRRLEYQVTSGRYQGRSHHVGNDGLWSLPGQYDILVEVKTTDTYRVSLDTIANYRVKLLEAQQISASSSILLVVGRDDNGELESQIRGSRHAWDMRLISVEALLRLVNLKETRTDSAQTIAKIRSLLRPTDFTRLDNLIDIVFSAATDIETPLIPGNDAGGQEQAAAGATDGKDLQAKRDKILDSLARKLAVPLTRKSRALYWDETRLTRVACTVSKRYSRKDALPYWYAYHPTWDEFLRDAKAGYLVLGCMDLPTAFAIPSEVVRARLTEMNKTVKEDGTQYWHIKIVERTPGEYFLHMPQSGGHVPLSPYAFEV